MSACRCDRIKSYIVEAGDHRCPHDVDISLHKNISPVPSRYIRTIHWLPGVKCRSQAKMGALQGRREKRTTVVDWSCGTVLLFYCCELRSCIVVCAVLF